MGCLEQITSWEMLHKPEVVGQLDAEGFYELVKAAGYGEKEAKRAAKERAWERMKRDLPP